MCERSRAWVWGIVKGGDQSTPCGIRGAGYCSWYQANEPSPGHDTIEGCIVGIVMVSLELVVSLWSQTSLHMNGTRPRTCLRTALF